MTDSPRVIAATASAGNGDTPSNPASAHAPSRFWVLALGSVGVVYGDIGTSPLYAVREATLAAAGTADKVQVPLVLGVLSMIIWALIIVVSLKYVVLLLRADNRGEGGTLALMALARRAFPGGVGFVTVLGMISAALFYGDAIITPSLSVLSAVEGLKVVTSAFEPYVVPLTIVILLTLFMVQSRGTASVAALFGPITLVWFIVLAVAGIVQIAAEPRVLYAFSPTHAIWFMTSHGMIGLITLGAVFLAVTGAEALYADLGHFGRKPIQFAWFAVVFPALVINYLGQGALVIGAPHTIENPFFLMFPNWALIPVVVLATAATVIASQAVITGAYSLTRQAVQLGLLPRLEIRHTSESHAGQIYMPRVNTLLLLGVLLLVVLFKSSSGLASAYGIAVTGTMVVTGLLAFIVVWRVWRWHWFLAGALLVPFLLIDITFLVANLVKIVEGGWIPLALGGVIVAIMMSWRRGSRLLFDKTRKMETPLADLVAMLEARPPQRVPGTAVFLTNDPEFAPTALLHSLKHYKVLHEKNVILHVETLPWPLVPESDRVTLETISESFSRVTLKFGFMEQPNVPKALAIARKLGWQFDIMSTSFFVSRRSLKPAAKSGMPRWQDHLFIALSRTANDATSYFQIPTGRVVEVGTQVAV